MNVAHEGLRLSMTVTRGHEKEGRRYSHQPGVCMALGIDKHQLYPGIWGRGSLKDTCCGWIWGRVTLWEEMGRGLLLLQGFMSQGQHETPRMEILADSLLA